MKENGPLSLIKDGYKKCGEIFRIQILHKSVTFLIGPDASEVLFNANDSTVTSREIYSFMNAVFGKGIVYDTPLEKMTQQLRMVRHGLGTTHMDSYCSKIINEVQKYFNKWPSEGECDIHLKMSELTILSASCCLLGDEIRATITEEFGPLYQDLSDGISHLSIFAPHFPSDAHRRRDLARKKIIPLFTKVIEERRRTGTKADDFLQTIMDSEYRDGKKPTIDEIVGLLIAALFGGQHTSTITST